MWCALPASQTYRQQPTPWSGTRAQGNLMHCIAGEGTDSRLRGWRDWLEVYALAGGGGRGVMFTE